MDVAAQPADEDCAANDHSTTSASAIAYYRVSTRAQGHSGLGIDPQLATVTRFAAEERNRILG